MLSGKVSSEDLTDFLENNFISDYYLTLDFEEKGEADFEVIQNNYSNRKLVGVELKMTDSVNFKKICKPNLAKLSKINA